MHLRPVNVYCTFWHTVYSLVLYLTHCTYSPSSRMYVLPRHLYPVTFYFAHTGRCCKAWASKQPVHLLCYTIYIPIFFFYPNCSSTNHQNNCLVCENVLGVKLDSDSACTIAIWQFDNFFLLLMNNTYCFNRLYFHRMCICFCIKHHIVTLCKILPTAF